MLSLCYGISIIALILIIGFGVIINVIEDITGKNLIESTATKIYRKFYKER